MADQEPRYRLVDSNGNPVGSLYWDGTDVVMEELANENNIKLQSDGTLNATNGAFDSLNTDDASITSSLTDPSGTVQREKLVGAFGTETPTAYFAGPAHGEGGNAFIGATLSPDGRVIFAPTDSSNVGIFDPATDSYTSGPAHGEGGAAFRGATLSPDGRVIFVPFGSSNVGIVSQLLDIATANTANR